MSLLRTPGSSASDVKEAIAILEKTVKTIGKEFVPSLRAALTEGYLKEYRFAMKKKGDFLFFLILCTADFLTLCTKLEPLWRCYQIKRRFVGQK